MIASTSDKLETLTNLKAFDIEAAAKKLGSGQDKKQARQEALFEKKRDLERQKATAEAAEEELRKRVALATCEMTKLQRQVICYYLFDGLKLDKVAEKIEKSYRYTRKLWQEARAILAEY